MSLLKVTEQESNHQHLEQKPIGEILYLINQEDGLVPLAVSKCIPSIQLFVEALVPRIQRGGRLFYIGAGTSGRLGILDASECPPTFGVSHDLVNGIIAGGDLAIRKAVEFAEDDMDQAWKDLKTFYIDELDTVVGIAASGTTPYVIGGLKSCQENKISTACICCNEGSPIAAFADHKIECIVGPEFVTGSTRMKSGTAQKLILNMISTSLMISIGRVKGNRMVDMQLTNEKLVERGIRMIQLECNINYDTAKELLVKYKSVRKVLTEIEGNKVRSI
ncbi:MAG: N-acetylmuramic acid 6-phosphate etherase [Saprospiraceae bacterium]